MARAIAKADFPATFAALRAILAAHALQLRVNVDTDAKYTLLTLSPSAFPQHKGKPMWFGELRLGKAYVSIHLMALYMNDDLQTTISPELRKHMQGKTCFNFRIVPRPEILAELDHLTAKSVSVFEERKWL